MIVDIIAPSWVDYQSLCMSKHKEGVFGPSDRHIHSLLILYKPDLLLFVSSDATDDDHIHLLPLESIHCAYPYVVSFLLTHRHFIIDLVLQVLDLRFVRCNNANFQARIIKQKTAYKYGNAICFSLVLVRFLQPFLFSILNIEEHRTRLKLSQTVRNCNFLSQFQFVLVELSVWELLQGLNHSILQIQQIRNTAQGYQPFKKTTIEFRKPIVRTHDSWLELHMIANQYDFGSKSIKGNEGAWFAGLTCFIDDKATNLALVGIIKLSIATCIQGSQDDLTVLQILFLGFIVQFHILHQLQFLIYLNNLFNLVISLIFLKIYQSLFLSLFHHSIYLGLENLFLPSQFCAPFIWLVLGSPDFDFAKVGQIYLQQQFIKLLSIPQSQNIRQLLPSDKSVCEYFPSDMIDSSIGLCTYHNFIAWIILQSLLKVMLLQRCEIDNRLCFASSWRALNQIYSCLSFENIFDGIKLSIISLSFNSVVNIARIHIMQPFSLLLRVSFGLFLPNYLFDERKRDRITYSSVLSHSRYN